MLDNNHKNSPCDFAGKLVSYLYGETSEREKIEFESHLENCSNCADEFESFGALRNSLFEWKKEFSVLETPAFVLPNEKLQRFTKEVTITNEKRAKFADFRTVFSFFPKFAAGLTVLAISFGLFLIASKIFQNNEVAQNDLKNINSIASSSAIEKKIQQLEEANSSGDSVDKTAKSQNSDNKSVTEKDTFSRQNDSGKSFLKDPKVSQIPVSNYKSSQNKIKKETVRDKQVYNSQRTIASKKAPTLVEVNDEEDDSMRLADLFEEVGGR